jgi:uncharacterized protein GlcG (DUF336 family)/mannose-6-phosphate isomerase-like protein (cupin superfamily)
VSIVRGFTAVAALVLLGAAHAEAASVGEKKVLTLGGARKVIAAAEAEAKRLNAPGGVIAVVDDGGSLVAMERLDGTFAAGSTISVGKARTSALFKKPTKVFEDIVNKGRTAMAALPDSLFTPLQGGVPIVVDGQVIGAVGVSGAASAQQDEDIALAGAAAALASIDAASTTYLDHAQVSAAFAKGMPLIENGIYKVHASRREAPGLVEIHEHETDVVYVIEGTATLVTGGQVLEPKVVAPGEIRGTGLSGGQTRQLARGDVVVIPPNTPHWFREVSAPFLYFVVKPISD